MTQKAKKQIEKEKFSKFRVNKYEEKQKMENSENPTYTVEISKALVKRRIQCAGPHFIKYLHKIHTGLDGTLSSASSTDEISVNETEFEIDIDYLRSLDPKEWKDQDHYRVLGIKNLR